MGESVEEKEKTQSKYKEAREHMRAAHRAWHESMKLLLPEGFVEKRKAARKEFLLGLRSIIDATIERIEK